MENTADDIILKIIQFYNKNEFLFTISEKAEYRNKNKKTEINGYFCLIYY